MHTRAFQTKEYCVSNACPYEANMRISPSVMYKMPEHRAAIFYTVGSERHNLCNTYYPLCAATLESFA